MKDRPRPTMHPSACVSINKGRTRRGARFIETMHIRAPSHNRMHLTTAPHTQSCRVRGTHRVRTRREEAVISKRVDTLNHFSVHDCGDDVTLCRLS